MILVNCLIKENKMKFIILHKELQKASLNGNKLSEEINQKKEKMLLCWENMFPSRCNSTVS